MSGARHRQKGNRVEREIVQLHRDLGIHAERYPCRQTLFRWMARNPTFRQSYVIAQEMHADHICDQAVEIANNASEDIKDGKSNMAAVNRDRLRVDTLKWRAAKLFPRRYSERYQVSGNDEQPIQQSVVSLPMNREEVTAHFKEVLARAEQEMDLPALPNASDEARLSAIVNSNKDPSPEIYELMHAARSGKPNGKPNGN
jgi:hypothetical protein